MPMTVSPLTGLRVLSTRSVMIKPCRNGNLPIQRQVATINTGSDPVPSATEDGMTAAKMDPSLRLHAIRLYKELHRLGRDYPDEEYEFNKRLRRAYEKNAKITDPNELRAQLARAEHIKREILAMFSLKKYRTLKRMYTWPAQ